MLLGGSSKLAKLAEERRKKAEAARTRAGDGSEGLTVNATVTSLDRLALSRSKDSKENEVPSPKAEPRKYPPRKRRESTPPPAAPEPELQEEPKEQLPDLRASPSAFGRTLARKPNHLGNRAKMGIQDVLGGCESSKAFQDPSPDDVVFKAQEHSKGLNK